MNEFKMNKFGIMLTDREDGKKAFLEIIQNKEYPDLLDFYGVISMGSSFGDEVLPKLASHHKNSLFIKNANQAIKSCISKIIEDTGIIINYC